MNFSNTTRRTDGTHVNYNDLYQEPKSDFKEVYLIRQYML